MLNDSATAFLSHALCDLAPAVLVEQAIQRGEGVLADNGALVVSTGAFTGRSPQDKYIVDIPSIHEEIAWEEGNHPLSEESFRRLLERVKAHMGTRTVFLQHLCAGTHPQHQVRVEVATTYAWQSLFIRQLLVHDSALRGLPPNTTTFTLLCAPDCYAVPSEDGTRSETFIAIHFGERVVLIGGTAYAGEIKKAVFTLMNYLLPKRGVFPMHCAANVGEQGDVALFFGLSGTGKTTLSTSESRALIGDDEHGWSEDGVFNFEGGCYAKCIGLSPTLEHPIWEAIRFGAVLENVDIDMATRHLNYASARLTENTRAAYPLEYIPHAYVGQHAGHPRNIFFLAADAFGVLPPICRLTEAQAVYYFLNGYTAKVAGTERGLGDEPKAVFSACFAAPFLPLPAAQYTTMFWQKLRHHKATVWLVNTGWIGGPCGKGTRIPLEWTRRLVDAALTGELDTAPYRLDPLWGWHVPQEVPGVPRSVLKPQQGWETEEAYRNMAQILAHRFQENFSRYAASLPPEIVAAAPRLG